MPSFLACWSEMGTWVLAREEEGGDEGGGGLPPWPASPVSSAREVGGRSRKLGFRVAPTILFRGRRAARDGMVDGHRVAVFRNNPFLLSISSTLSANIILFESSIFHQMTDR